MRRLLIILTASLAVAQSPGGPPVSTFEGQPAVTLSNDRLQMTVMVHGSSIASLVMTDDAQKLSPYWNPFELVRLGYAEELPYAIASFQAALRIYTEQDYPQQHLATTEILQKLLESSDTARAG